MSASFFGLILGDWAFFGSLKGGIGENQNKLRCQIKIVWHLLGMST